MGESKHTQADLERRVAELEAESAELTKALTGLTCGGSEFFLRKGNRYVANIPACVAWIERRDRDAHNRYLAERQKAAAAPEMKEALEKARHLIDTLDAVATFRSMTSKPQFWAEDDRIVCEMFVLSIDAAGDLSRQLERDGHTELLTDLLPAIREATSNHMKRVAA